MGIGRSFFALVLSAVTAGAISNASGEPEKVIRIGYQKSGVFLLLRNEGTLEKKFAPLGYSIEWREFSYGSPIFEALNAGSIDIGHSGDAPVIFAQAAGIPFVYIAATDESPESAGVLVRKNSPIQNCTELRGKTIAFAKGSSSHHLLAQSYTSPDQSVGKCLPRNPIGSHEAILVYSYPRRRPQSRYQ